MANWTEAPDLRDLYVVGVSTVFGSVVESRITSSGGGLGFTGSLARPPEVVSVQCVIYSTWCRSDCQVSVRDFSIIQLSSGPGSSAPFIGKYGEVRGQLRP